MADETKTQEQQAEKPQRARRGDAKQTPNQKNVDLRQLVADAEAEAEELKGDVATHMLEAQERGYYGFVPDPTPNENYTIAGVTSGAPTPETDPSLRREARARTTLPGDLPFIPGTQEQFDALMDAEAHPKR